MKVVLISFILILIVKVNLADKRDSDIRNNLRDNNKKANKVIDVQEEFSLIHDKVVNEENSIDAFIIKEINKILSYEKHIFKIPIINAGNYKEEYETNQYNNIDLLGDKIEYKRLIDDDISFSLDNNNNDDEKTGNIEKKLIVERNFTNDNQVYFNNDNISNSNRKIDGEFIKGIPKQHRLNTFNEENKNNSNFEFIETAPLKLFDLKDKTKSDENTFNNFSNVSISFVFSAFLIFLGFSISFILFIIFVIMSW